MKRAVIFDMDGVLIDSQPLYFLADSETLKLAGKHVAPSFPVAYAGLANKERWAKYKEDLGLELEIESLVQKNIHIFNSMLDENPILPIPGITALVAAIQNKGVQLAVASSSPYTLIYKVLESIGLDQAFQVVVSGEDLKRSKPEPDVFLLTAKKLGISPEDCVVIEDSTHGVTAAVRANMYCIGFKNINSGNQDLSAAQLITDDFYQLVENTLWLN